MRKIFSAAYCFILIVIGVFTSPSYAAEFISGNDMLQLLQSKKATENLYAFYYIRGALDAEKKSLIAESFSSDLDKQNVKFRIKHLCLGNGMNFSQVTDIYKKYLINHPESRQKYAQALLHEALLEDFACANNP